MTFGISPGVYSVETNQSVIVPAVSTAAAAIVVHSVKGPLTPVHITSNQQLINTFGSPRTSDPSMYAALSYLQYGNSLWVTRVLGGGSSGTAASATYAWKDVATTPATIFNVSAANQGKWGNNISIEVTDNSTKQAGTFYITVYYNSVQVEDWLVSRSTTQLDGFGNSLYLQNVINGNSAYITVADVPTDSSTPSFSSGSATPLSGGAEDGIVADSDVVTAYNQFQSVETYNFTFLIGAGWCTSLSAVVPTALVSMAQTRGDCIALLDVPESSTVAEMKTFSGTTLNADSSYGALYGGWVQIYDSYNAVNVMVPPSGFVAGICAYTQQVGNPWDAPAGMRRGVLNSAIGVETVFDEGDRDNLQEANVNPIQSFTGQGIMVYGQKTLTAIPSALSRINVRMLLITIEKAITVALRPFVFEVNDTFTQENISSLITNYMNTVESNGGVYDFKVVCDASNNTPQVVDDNELIVTLYVKPTRTAEYIQLNTIVSATGVAFSN